MCAGRLLQHAFSSKRIDDLHVGKILLVVGDDDTVIGLCNRCDNCVESAPGSSFGSSLGHQAGPNQARPLVKWQYTTCEKYRRAFRAGKPGIKLVALPAGWFFQNTAPDFGDGERGNEQILVDLFSHPGQQRFRRRQLCDVADDVGIKEITAHSSTLRPVSNRRTGAMSAPTRGERRSASRMPPFLGGSPEIVWLTTARSREASGPSSAKRRASDRMRSRSPSSPRTSNRAIPRLRRRFR